MPPARDWFYGVRTFAASMIALYIAMLMQMPRPYWAMATVYIVSSPYVGPTSSKALYRAIGTFLGAAAAVLFVPMFVQSPYLLVVIIALWTGILLFLSMHLRTANNYALMLAGYTLPLIALPVVDNPLGVWDVAEARTEEIFLGIVCAAVIGSMFWPRRLAPVFVDSAAKWFADAALYSQRFLARNVQPEEVSGLRASMVGTFNTLELMIGQLPHEGARPQTVRNTKELRGRMINLLPVVDALDDALYALERRTPELVAQFAPLLAKADEWLQGTARDASVERWQALRDELEALQPSPEALDDRRQLLMSNALYRLGEWIDLWQDCRSLQHAIQSESQAPWRAVYRHWRLGRLTPFLDRGLMLYSAGSTVLAIIVASVLWILLGWTDGGSAVILAAVACSFFASMDDPAPQIYRFFFWTAMSVLFASLYLFLILPNLHDFPMLVLAFAVPFICVGTLTVQPRFYLGMLLTIVNTSSFISIQGAYDADFLSFANSNLAGPMGPAVRLCLDPDRPAFRLRTGGQAPDPLQLARHRQPQRTGDPGRTPAHGCTDARPPDAAPAAPGHDRAGHRHSPAGVARGPQYAGPAGLRTAGAGCGPEPAAPGGGRGGRVLQGLPQGRRTPAGPQRAADDPRPYPPRPRQPGPARRPRNPPAPAARPQRPAPGAVAGGGIRRHRRA